MKFIDEFVLAKQNYHHHLDAKVPKTKDPEYQRRQLLKKKQPEFETTEETESRTTRPNMKDIVPRYDCKIILTLLPPITIIIYE